MSNTASGQPPADPNTRTRTTLRVLGGLLAAAGLGFTAVALADFFSTMGDNSFSASGPTKFWMFFVGLPLLGVGGWLLQAGFYRAASRYMASEAAPALRETGEALGLRPAASGSGPFCRSCGTRNDPEARFCDSCGASMSG